LDPDTTTFSISKLFASCFITYHIAFGLKALPAGSWSNMESVVSVQRSTPQAKTDPDSLVAPAVRGTEAALKAAWDSGSQVFVMTSSSATIAPSSAKKGGCGGAGLRCDMYDERDYHDVATPSYGTYSYSKVKAEQAAVVLQEKLTTAAAANGGSTSRITSSFDLNPNGCPPSPLCSILVSYPSEVWVEAVPRCCLWSWSTVLCVELYHGDVCGAVPQCSVWSCATVRCL
jgi:hypothetical protein